MGSPCYRGKKSIKKKKKIFFQRETPGLSASNKYLSASVLLCLSVCLLVSNKSQDG